MLAFETHEETITQQPLQQSQEYTKTIRETGVYRLKTGLNTYESAPGFKLLIYR